MRFDLFFWMGFSVQVCFQILFAPSRLRLIQIIQLIALVLQKGDFEFYITIAALPLSMLLVFEGHLAARHESRWMMGIFSFGLVAAMVYFIYKVCAVPF